MDELAVLRLRKRRPGKRHGEWPLRSGFATYWTVRNDPALKDAKLDPLTVARDVEKLTFGVFRTAPVNPVTSRLRLSMYDPCSPLSKIPRRNLDEKMGPVLRRRRARQESIFTLNKSSSTVTSLGCPGSRATHAGVPLADEGSGASAPLWTVSLAVDLADGRWISGLCHCPRTAPPPGAYPRQAVQGAYDGSHPRLA